MGVRVALISFSTRNQKRFIAQAVPILLFIAGSARSFFHDADKQHVDDDSTSRLLDTIVLS